MEQEMMIQPHYLVTPVELTDKLKADGGAYGMKGLSEAMRCVYKLIELVAPIEANVVIVGESGTGKELLAKAIHQNSGRKGGPFFAINCGALQESLLESELFGYEKGAFTDAKGLKLGYFDLARNGTIFLDEVAEMSKKMQVDLLRVLQDKQFRRVGSTELLTVDSRVITASSLSLEQAVEIKNFYEPLKYRLEVMPISLPPLRERVEDIPLLATYFVEMYSKMYRRMVAISQDGGEYLKQFTWSGNVRELENFIQKAIILNEESAIKAANSSNEPVPLTIGYLERLLKLSESNGHKGITDSHAKGWVAQGLSLKQAKEEAERIYMIALLEEHDGNVSSAAKVAGIYRADFYDLITKYRLHEKLKEERGGYEYVRTPRRAEDKEWLERALVKHHGNLGEAARDINVNKNIRQLRYLINKYNMQEILREIREGNIAQE